MIRQRGSKTARKELTPRVRSMTEGLRLTGLSYRKIQEHINNKENLNISVGTIYNTIKKAPERDDNKSAPRGLPRKTNERTDRHIFLESRRDRRQPLAELKQTIAPTVPGGISVRTIQRRLQEQRIKKWLATPKPLLTLDQKRARLAWAIEHAEWDVWDWAGVWWSDECGVKKGIGAQQVWVFRMPGEKWLEDCIIPETKSKGVNIMVWACFAGRRKGPLRVLKGDPNIGRGGVRGVDIRNIYDEILPSRIADHEVFMQDGAGIHTSTAVKVWLERQAFRTMDWPAYSPDMNPIEHCWAHMKRIIYKNHPELITERIPDARLKVELLAAIQEAWEEISEEFLWELCESMERRIAALINARGGYTKY